ncbi:MAG: GNAT family N-acetyltransferase [Aeoliella sp.]
MSVTYFKRYRMETDLRRRRIVAAQLPLGYRLVPWFQSAIEDHAETKYLSFRHEIDSNIFDCLSELDGCYKLMEDIATRDGFVPEATWLVEFTDHLGNREMCGTIQGMRINRHYGGIQNVGVTSFHRGQGVGAALVGAAMTGFQQVGVPRAYLEVTAQNKSAVRLYKRLGFRRTKTLYKAVELAYS